LITNRRIRVSRRLRHRVPNGKSLVSDPRSKNSPNYW